jgi:HK97 gp10 family phage protein
MSEWGDIIKGKSASKYFGTTNKVSDVVMSERGSLTVTLDLGDFDIEIQRFINDNAETIAKQIATDARASTAFKDYKGTARESNWSKKTWGPKARKLRKSIRAKKSKFDAGGWIVQATAPHAWLVEFGHGGPKPAPAHPYLKPALDKNINAAIREFGAR